MHCFITMLDVIINNQMYVFQIKNFNVFHPVTGSLISYFSVRLCLSVQRDTLNSM